MAKASPAVKSAWIAAASAILVALIAGSFTAYNSGAKQAPIKPTTESTGTTSGESSPNINVQGSQGTTVIISPNGHNAKASKSIDEPTDSGSAKSGSGDLEIYQDSVTNKYGLKRANGVVVVRPHFDGITKIDEVADVFEVTKKQASGVIRGDGTTLVPVEYSAVIVPFGQTDCSWVRRGDLQGVISFDGNMQVPLGKYHEIRTFHDNVFEVRISHSERGLMRSGRWILQPIYIQIGSPIGNDTGFAEGLTIIATNDKCGLVSQSGEIVCPIEYDEIDAQGGLSFGKGRYVESPSYVYSLTQRYEYGAPLFCEGLVRAKKNGKYGYLNKHGMKAIDFAFADARCFSDGVAAVAKDDKWVYIDKAGAQVGNKSFDSAQEFKDGRARVLLNKDWFAIDRRGNCVANCPVSIEARAHGNDILAAQGRWVGFNEIDVTLRNKSQDVVLIDKISLHVIKEASAFAAPIVPHSAKYDMPIDRIGEGNTEFLDVAHKVDARNADRFLIDVYTTGVGYKARITLYFNDDKYVFFDVSN